MPLSHFIDLNHLPRQQWDKLVSEAIAMRLSPSDYHEYCRGKILSTLFYEPSTRTQFSFQSAMYRLGGQVIGFDSPGTTSVAKGESLEDTIRMLGNYSDIIAMRHPMDGAAVAACKVSSVPIINAGDGRHLHPTQTLTDLVTLKIEKGTTENLCIGVCGDLKYGRTVHSLLRAMACYGGNKFILISTKELNIPQYVKDFLDKKGCSYTYVNSLYEAIPLLDVLYMTRIQKERFPSLQEYEAQRGVFILDSEKMKLAKPDMIVMHPLPRVDEIAVEVDSDSRAVYFKQAQNGVFARMALINNILQGTLTPVGACYENWEQDSKGCKNTRCISAAERLPALNKKSDNGVFCGYCDQKID